MRFVRFGDARAERFGALDTDDALRDISGHAQVNADLKRVKPADISVAAKVADAPRLGCPVLNVGKIICIGLNYRSHAVEAGMPVPEEPIVFMKATSAICGPNDPLELPRGSAKTDWEVELGVVIGSHAKYVDEADALAHVAGYVTCNDVSERAFQIERGGQWTKGKSCDSFAPIGPWFVPANQIADPQNLALRAWVNGDIVQDGNTSDMIFTVAQIISYLSQMMSLHPGDVIMTGTPPGVGMGMTPPRYLGKGDIVEVEVEGLGRQRQVVV
ncbi:fumarylacetoacetate hydrolase family protein [Nereida sp. MMG025]|uniref:fumarylacetoacetate hydrolase family protein n=1 Tax=Nereida sp. MMG025 TaxID=2909981 RepID=UPI001F488DA2|nr:fumarylacetoacetate hydrolase family protein [Nereida sp. MMG025]MCF6445163.1 fumarylacetoacetate hydrolase family protein [Nereida sp. MMG025]